MEKIKTRTFLKSVFQVKFKLTSSGTRVIRYLIYTKIKLTVKSYAAVYFSEGIFGNAPVGSDVESLEISDQQNHSNFEERFADHLDLVFVTGNYHFTWKEKAFDDEQQEQVEQEKKLVP